MAKDGRIEYNTPTIDTADVLFFAKNSGIKRANSDKPYPAVTEHQLDWVQLKNNEKYNTKNAAVMYAVQGYPTKLIISPDQKIANITVGEDPNFYVELNKLIKTK